jgi:prolyl oligopeptidase
MLRGFALTASLALAGAMGACAGSDPVVFAPAVPAGGADAGKGARPGAVTETIHGVTVNDPFRSLEDDKSPETRAFLQREANKLEHYLAGVPGRDALESDIASVLHVGTVAPPEVRELAGPRTHAGARARRYFHTKREGTQNQPTLYVRDGAASADRPLIDASALSADGTVSIDWWYPSWDGALVAWGRSESGSEDSTLVVRDVATGKDLPDRITRARHASVAWLPGGKSFFYSRYPAPGTVPPGDDRYSPRIFRHVLGADPEADPVVFGSTRDKTDVPEVMTSPNGRYLVIVVDEGWSKSEVYLRDLTLGDRAPWIEVAVRTEALFEPIVRDDKLYILTNDGAPHYRLFAVDYAKPDRTHWKEVLPEGPDVLTDVGVGGDVLVATYLHDAAAHVALFSLVGKAKGEITLPGLGSAHASTPHVGGETFVEYVSFVTPPRVLRVDLAATKKGKAAASAKGEPASAAAPSTWDQVAGDFSAEGVTVSRTIATSKDGTKVPMFIVAKEPASKEPRPTLLWGYGGFNINVTPAFSARALVMAKRGGVFASAVLRGGGEMGEEWHRAGMLDKKQNVFDDFIACAEELERSGVTSVERLAIGGGSNGGLLTSVAVVQRPDLFRAALSLVPLTDMVRYTRFQIAKLWIPEYGDPERAADFGWLYAYSPYHHVKDGVRYPAVFFATAESDTRVDPMHARKMAARLEEAQAAPEHPILLRVESKAGHGAGKPTAKVLAQTTDEMSFVLHELGAL